MKSQDIKGQAPLAAGLCSGFIGRGNCRSNAKPIVAQAETGQVMNYAVSVRFTQEDLSIAFFHKLAIVKSQQL